MSVNAVVSFTWQFPLWHSHKGYTLKTGQIIVNDEIVQTYPDNDGGAWYYHPETGEKVVIE